MQQSGCIRTECKVLHDSFSHYGIDLILRLHAARLLPIKIRVRGDSTQDIDRSIKASDDFYHTRSILVARTSQRVRDLIQEAAAARTPGKAPAYAGTDFIVARNGRIASVYLFFDNLP